MNKSRNSALVIASLFFITMALTQSVLIGMTVSFFGAMITALTKKASEKKQAHEFSKHLPELIDHIISGIQSGLSLTETLSSLGERGPTIFRESFSEFSHSVRTGNTFEKSILTLQATLKNRSVDQLCESLLYTRVIGGNDLVSMLRQLANFTRSDAMFREEIHAKQSWIRNSAHMSAAAPWILLVLLSTQPATATAYSSKGGVLILASGLFLTCCAYLWMAHLSHLPEPARIFGEQ